MAMVPRFGRDRLIATYFGFFAMAGGIGSTLGSALVGRGAGRAIAAGAGWPALGHHVCAGLGSGG
jgi:hypothetical protein